MRTKDLPSWVIELRVEVTKLVERPKNRERFLGMIREWKRPEIQRRAVRDVDAARVRCPLPIGDKHLSLPEKYVALAMIHDSLIEESGRITPRAASAEDLADPYDAMAFIAFRDEDALREKLPDNSEALLRAALEDVKRDLQQASPTTGTVGSESPAVAIQGLAEFVFRPDGDGYLVRGFGEAGHITGKGAKGLHDIFRLVLAAGSPVPMIELDAGPGTKRLSGDSQSKQPIANSQTVIDIRNRRRGLQEEIDRATNDDEKAEAQQQLAELNAEALKLVSLRGKPRDLNNPINKLRPKLLKRKRTACNQMKKCGLSELADHFDLSIGSEDGCLVYRSVVPSVAWDTGDESVARKVTK